MWRRSRLVRAADRRCTPAGWIGGGRWSASVLLGNDDVSSARELRSRAMTTTERFFPRDEYFMRLALREAERALEHEDVPIGAVIAHEGEVIAAAHNERE